MKTTINPLVAAGIAIVALVLILVLMYRHTFRPTEGSMESMSPGERAKLMRSLAPPPPAPGPSRGYGQAPGSR